MLATPQVKGSHKHKRKEKNSHKTSVKRDELEKETGSEVNHDTVRDSGAVAEEVFSEKFPVEETDVRDNSNSYQYVTPEPQIEAAEAAETACIASGATTQNDDDDAVDVSLMLDKINVSQSGSSLQKSSICDNLQSIEDQTKDVINVGISHPLESDANKMFPTDYNNWLNAIKIDMDNYFEPTAPLPEIVSQTKVDEHQKNLLSFFINVETEEMLPASKKEENIINIEIEIGEEPMIPMTEEEMSQFYYNSELSQAQHCINKFIQEEMNNEAKVLHPFYELLTNYLKAKNSLKMKRLKIKDLDDKLDKYVSQMWTVWTDIEVSEVAKCMDGNSISITQKYTQAEFNQEVFEKFKGALFDIRSTLFEEFKIDSFNCIRYKLKIEQYIQALLRSCSGFTNLSESSPVSLAQSSSDSYFQQCLSNLTTSVGILFLFQRRQKIDMSSSFVQECRQWLDDLISVLIRAGDWKHHLFILNHILRCPGGVAEWAACYIQFPPLSPHCDAFSDPVIKHMMTVMSVLLRPIEKREDFMKEWNLIMPDENTWVMIDSDEEDDETSLSSSPLKENDLVLLLNQIPLTSLFGSILGLTDGKLNPTVITSNHLMKLFSFSYDFIKIVRIGLEVYSTERYKQFAKRLGRLIRHIIEYATNELDLFTLNNGRIESENLERLQVEYDNFFLNSAKTIYSSRIHGTWQFLAVVPYHRASRTVILKLYSALQLSESEKNPTVLQINLVDFEEKFQQLPESEQFYLLSTFMNMALARDLSEVQLIKAVVHQLLHIGFFGHMTRDQCYKNVKSLLYNICSKHPFLMSEILCIQNNRFLYNESCDQSLSIHLWKELPVTSWKPTTEDLQILTSWLIQPVQSVRSELGRIILKSLNYGIENGELFLPAETHRIIACSILRANEKAPQPHEMNVIKNVSSLVGLQEPEQALQVWSWNVLLKLRLHLFDQPPSIVRSSLADLHGNLQRIPDLVSIPELHEFVRQRNAIACYIALLTTTLGHSVPVIFNEGFALVEALIRARKTDAAISCLEYITLMFLECPESLYKCQHFTSVLSQLINADYSYLKLAKNLKAFETPGPVLLSLENMIQNQIQSCNEMGIDRACLIELWIKSLTKLPLWIQESGVIHLMDMLCKNAFFDVSASFSVKSMLTSILLETSSSPTESKSSLASLVNWMNNKISVPTLLCSGSNGNAVWFFFKVIEIEQEYHETSNFLWNELLKELHAANVKKTNVDNCLKKACSSLQIPSRTSEALTIYRLCYQILDTKPNHPLIVLLWQKFFVLFFNRVPGFVDNGSVGDKFFHGLVNQNLLKRLRQRLKDTIDCFSDIVSRCKESPHSSELYSKYLDIMHVFLLWLDEPKLHEPHLNLHTLPPQYRTELLSAVIYENVPPWIEYVNYDQVQHEINRCATIWSELKGRKMKGEWIKSPTAVDKSLIEKIQDGLSRYDTPLAVPKFYLQKKYSSPCVLRDCLLQADSVISYLKPSFKTVLDYADYYTQEMGEYIGLSCDLQDLVHLLYRLKKSSVTARQTCNGCEKVINGKRVYLKCSGPATVTLSFQESEVDMKNHDLFNQCLRNFNRCLQRSLQAPQLGLGLSVVTIERTIRELEKEYSFISSHAEDTKLTSDLMEIGVKLFFAFVDSWSESVMFAPPIASLFESCVDVLGKTFVTENPSQCEPFLNTVSNHPKLIDKLSRYFNPNAASTQDFIELYSKVKKSRSEIKLTLLSRFHVSRWLTERRPRFADRSMFISKIMSSLKSYGNCAREQLDLIQMLNSHLRQLLLYDFPEHYGEILNLLLEGSESQMIPVSTWFMFLNAIVPDGVHFVEGKCEDGKSFEPGQTVKKLKLHFSQYATHQNMLSPTDIRETIIHLANTFKTDRLQHGLYGLYPKYRHYVEPILIFFGMLSHSYVAETLKLDLGSLSARIADQLWPLIRDLYSPWLVPYWSKQEKSQSAKWIQDLTEDKCVLLPWINSDVSLATHASTIFIESVRFILDTLPGINSVLSHVWLFYVTNYAHIQVKDHVLRVIHANLLNLPWCTFFPNLQDIELMVKVVEHFIPMAHSLLGNIFVQIRWSDVVRYYTSQSDIDMLSKLHVYLLHLLVKLPCEPSLKQNNEILRLLNEARDYLWHLVDSNNYDAVLNWFVMSCDPRIVLMDEKSEYYKLDSMILQILQTCAGYSGMSHQLHPTTLTKRLMYIRANNKWLITANNRFKCKESALFKSAVLRMLNEIESTINLTVSPSREVDELTILLSEFLNIFKEEGLAPILEDIIIKWLLGKRSEILIYGLLRSVALSAVTPAIFGNIAEACLTSYFESNDDSSWSEINTRFVMYASGQSGLQKALIANSNVLTLYAILLKQFNDNTSPLEKKIIISDIFHSLTTVKRSESMEPKLFLMIVHVFRIAESVFEEDEAESVSILSRLSEHLVGFINDKGNNGLLSTFGLRKAEAFSNKFRFACLVASGAVMKLFKARYPQHEDKVDEKVLRSLEQSNTNKQYQSLSHYVAFAVDELTAVKSITQIVGILDRLGFDIFNKNYLK